MDQYFTQSHTYTYTSASAHTHTHTETTHRQAHTTSDYMLWQVETCHFSVASDSAFGRKVCFQFVCIFPDFIREAHPRTFSEWMMLALLRVGIRSWHLFYI